MTNYLSRQILYLLLLFSLMFNQECDIINSRNYGDCAMPLAMDGMGIIRY